MASNDYLEYFNHMKALFEKIDNVHLAYIATMMTLKELFIKVASSLNLPSLVGINLKVKHQEVSLVKQGSLQQADIAI
jgi:hypothetical protein